MVEGRVWRFHGCLSATIERWQERSEALSPFSPSPNVDQHYADHMPDALPANNGSSESNAQALNDGTSAITSKPDYPNLLDDPMLSEFGWPVGDDIFSSIWADGADGTI